MRLAAKPLFEDCDVDSCPNINPVDQHPAEVSICPGIRQDSYIGKPHMTGSLIVDFTADPVANTTRFIQLQSQRQFFQIEGLQSTLPAETSLQTLVEVVSQRAQIPMQGFTGHKTIGKA
jgi:hypothetical protein